MNLPTPGQRVFVSRPYVSLVSMQVCVVPDATDEEILKVCNAENPSGTSSGWTDVIGSAEHAKRLGFPETAAPGVCQECPPRLHKIVIC